MNRTWQHRHSEIYRCPPKPNSHRTNRRLVLLTTCKRPPASCFHRTYALNPAHGTATPPKATAADSVRWLCDKTDEKTLSVRKIDRTLYAVYRFLEKYVGFSKINWRGPMFPAMACSGGSSDASNPVFRTAYQRASHVLICPIRPGLLLIMSAKRWKNTADTSLAPALPHL